VLGRRDGAGVCFGVSPVRGALNGGTLPLERRGGGTGVLSSGGTAIDSPINEERRSGAA
jgi:hypothetical protein